MSNYLPHHSKKLQILSHRELSLYALIKVGAPRDKTVRAAEKVRDARIAAIKAQYEGYNVPSGPDTYIGMISKLPVETILAYFGATLTNVEQSSGFVDDQASKHNSNV